MALAPGSRVGRYEIVEKLGAGGLGEVYRARDTRLDRDVAVKALHAQFAASPDGRARFDREAKAIASLSHPNICSVYDVGVEDGVDYLVMELLTGETLQQRLASGPLTISAVIELAIGLTNGLDAAHARGLIHRDLKPANTFITDQGQPKILDFGLAKTFEGPEAVTHGLGELGTRVGAVAGTVPYMSPEQLRGEPLDARTDLFSLGVMLYEMMTGQRPFTGPTGAAISAAILAQDPAAPAALRAGLPDRLQDVILKMLEKDRQLRCQTAAEARADLTRIRRELDSKLGSSTRRVVAPSGPASRRRSRLVVPAVIAAVLGVGFVTWRATLKPASSEIGEAKHRQVTFLGNVYFAAISPDGRSVAYLSKGHLWVQDLAGGPALDVATGGEMANPVWSPRGDALAYSARHGKERLGLFTVPRLGGPARFVASDAWYMAWSPDGTRLAKATGASQGIEIVGLDGVRAGSVALGSVNAVRGLDWQASSDRIALLERDDQNRSVIWVVGSDGKDPRRVYTDASDLQSMRWAPNGSVVYSQRVRTEATDLIAIDFSNLENPTTRVLAAGLPRGALGSLSVASDGRSLLYLRRQSIGNLVVVDLTHPAETPRFLTSGTQVFSDPHVSPDGQWVAAVLESGASTHVVKLPMAGGDPIALTAGEARDVSPSWSPDGSHLAFGSDRGGAPGVWMMTGDGRELAHVPTTAVHSNRLVTWTPDGAVAWQLRTPDNVLIWRRRDLATGNETLLAPTITTGFVFSPTFSPRTDDMAIFWNGARRGLYLISGPGREPRFVAAELAPLGWSADGEVIYAHVALGGNALYAVSARTGDIRRLTTMSEGSIRNGDITPDRRSLVLEWLRSTGDAWLLENFDPSPKR